MLLHVLHEPTCGALSLRCRRHFPGTRTWKWSSALWFRASPVWHSPVQLCWNTPAALMEGLEEMGVLLELLLALRRQL